MLPDLPRVSFRSRGAWRFLSRARRFVLVHEGMDYFVDRGGWARPLHTTGAISVQVVKLLDPEKRPSR